MARDVASGRSVPGFNDAAEGPRFWVVEGDGAVVGAAFRTPPRSAVVTAMPRAAAGPLLDAFARDAPDAPGVLGPEEVTLSLAEAWGRRAGGHSRAGMRQRIYRCDVVRHAGTASGWPRAARPDDLSLVARWSEGFARDAGAAFTTTPAQHVRWVERGQLHLWGDPSPVCMAVAQGRVAGGARVGFVYTPPEARGRGYGTSLVAHVTRDLLDSGLDFCMLYADLANPVSNGIYTRIGYEPVVDVVEMALERLPR